MCVLQMAYTMDVVRNFVPEAMEVLADSVLNPRFFPWEVAQAVEKMREDIKQAKENPQSVLLEVGHFVYICEGTFKLTELLSHLPHCTTQSQRTCLVPAAKCRVILHVRCTCITMSVISK